MSISSLYLDAFMAVAGEQGFSSAAKRLGITQSALSQRVKNLENDLGLTLFIRTPTMVRLTEQGQRLLRYCQTKDSLESELLGDLGAGEMNELPGIVRVGAYSSVLRSVVIPALSPVLKKHPLLECEFICSQMSELPGMLQRAEVDFIIMDYTLDRSGIESGKLGVEKFVVIESKKEQARNNIYLDNNPQDMATENFFKFQKGKTPKYQRAYFDDCYGIIDGVAAGLGRAVMSEHLIADSKGIQIVSGFKSYETPVVLHYYAQPFYSGLHKAILEELMKNCPKYLG